MGSLFPILVKGADNPPCTSQVCPLDGWVTDTYLINIEITGYDDIDVASLMLWYKDEWHGWTCSGV